VQIAQTGSTYFQEKRYIRSQLAKAPKLKELDSIRIEHEKKVNNYKRLDSDYRILRQRNVQLVRAFFVEPNPLFLGDLGTGLLHIQRDDPSAWQEFEQLRTRYYEAFSGNSGGIEAPELGHLSSEIWRKNSELTRSGRNHMYKIRRFLQKKWVTHVKNLHRNELSAQHALALAGHQAVEAVAI
jgi:hypothetical protein